MVYLHPKDKVDLTNTFLALVTYCTAKRCLHGPTRLNSHGTLLILLQKQINKKTTWMQKQLGGNVIILN